MYLEIVSPEKTLFNGDVGINNIKDIKEHISNVK